MRSVNMNWVSLNQALNVIPIGCNSDFALFLELEFAATRLQAKYKGYKAKGEYRKQKEAGKFPQHMTQNDA